MQILDPNNPTVSLESALIGALLDNNNRYDEISDFFIPDYFYCDLYKNLYKRIVYLINTKEEGQENERISLESLVHFTSKEPYFNDDQHHAREFLYTLVISKSYSFFNIREAAQSIKQDYLARAMTELCEHTKSTIEDCNAREKITDIIVAHESKLFSLVEEKTSTVYRLSQLTDIVKELIDKVLKDGKGIIGIPTGFKLLDSIINGLNKASLTIIAARPSMGKTALAMCMSINIARHFVEEAMATKQEVKKVLFLSLEMSAAHLILRIASSIANLNVHKVQKGFISEHELLKLENIMKEQIANLPIVIDDTSDIEISSLLSTIRRNKRTHNIGCVFVDYLQLIKSSAYKGQRVMEITEITHTLKAIAKYLDIPVVALSQLSRATEAREDKKPQLYDLRDSGSIEQDADIVLLLYREAYYLQRKQPDKTSPLFHEWAESMKEVYHKAELYVAKNRNGAIGNINLFFDPEITKFDNLAN